MKKILMMNIIAGCLLLLIINSCSVWDMIGAGAGSIKLYSIHGVNNRNQLEYAIIDLYEKKNLYSNTDRLLQIMKSSYRISDKSKLDSIYDNVKKKHFVTDDSGEKSFQIYIPKLNTFFIVYVGNYQGKLIGCDFFISNIFRDNLDYHYYKMPKKEQQEAIKVFEREILPLIRENVERIRKEKK